MCGYFYLIILTLTKIYEVHKCTKMFFVEFIEKLRAENDFLRRESAAKLQLDKPTFSKIELDQPKATNIICQIVKYAKR